MSKKNKFLYDYDDIIKEILMSKNNIDQEKNSPLMEEFNFKNAQDLLEFEEFPYLIGDIKKENYTEFFIQLFQSLNPINKYIVMLVLRFMDHKINDNKFNSNGSSNMAKINKVYFDLDDNKVIKKIEEQLDKEAKKDVYTDEGYIGKLYRNLINLNENVTKCKNSKVYDCYHQLFHVSKTMRLFASKYWNENCNDVNWLFKSLSSHDKDAIIMLTRKLKYFYNDVAVNDKKCPEASLDLTEYILQQNAIFEVLPELIDKDKS